MTGWKLKAIPKREQAMDTCSFDVGNVILSKNSTSTDSFILVKATEERAP